MTALPLKQVYAMFLQCDWWRRLSRAKIASVGCCERCHARGSLQSHHRFYRDNWFDTQLDDLEVLCRSCHEKEHGITPEPAPVLSVLDDPEIPSWAFTGDAVAGKISEFTTMAELVAARSAQKIDRRTFLLWRDKLRRIPFTPKPVSAYDRATKELRKTAWRHVKKKKRQPMGRKQLDRLYRGRKKPGAIKSCLNDPVYAARWGRKAK